jgi:adenosylcobinamide kinase / adenosylcobinamide-phosphate guanylyltransferase
MRVLVEGTGGAHGWPEPGCRCASCLRRARDGNARKRSAIVVDGVVRLAAGELEPAAGGYLVRRLPDARGAAWSGGLGGPDLEAGGLGGWDVTAPDGGRLLYPAGPGAVPVPPPGAEPYDLAFLDLLGEPAQLGLLRARGLVTGDTITAVAFADHRVPSETELRQRCRFWNAGVPTEGEAVTNARSGKKVLSGPWRVLVLGGARSGKSERAELRLAGEPDVTYVAAGAGGSNPDPDPDPDWAARVAAHRARRPAWWRTAETTDVAGMLASANGALLVDGIGTWLAAALGECGAWDEADGWAERLAGRTGGLVAAWRQTGARVVAVSDEAGLGVVPATPAGRLFRDELGRLNQRLAAESDEAELVVAGRILPLAPG